MLKKLFLTSSLLFSVVTAQAHCPIPFTEQGNNYCAEIEWQKTSIKNKDQWTETTSLSPYLNPMGTLPVKWQYSRAHIHTWIKGDTSHAPTMIPALRFFPYMIMEDGMHHGISYDEHYDSNLGVYVVEHMAFQEMPGCWSLRSTVQATDDFSTSELFADLMRCSTTSDGAMDHSH